MNCPICSAEVDGRVEHCPRCGFNLRLGPRAETEPVSKEQARPPEPSPASERADAAEPVPVTGEPLPPADSGTPVTRCERCGESRVDSIFRCGDRASSQCPYVEEQRPKRLPSVASILVCAVAAMGLGALTLPLTGSPLAALSAAGVALIIGGYLVSSIRLEQLIYRSTRAQLERVTLWGHELRRHFVTPPELVKLDLSPVSSLRYPPSVAVLTTHDAAAVVRAALIGLMMDEQIHPLQYRFHRLGPDGASTSSQDYCLLSRGGPEGEARAKGWLEGALFRASAGRPTVDKVVHDIYDKDKSDPGSWLLKQVQESAASRGWGQIRGGLFLKQFEPGPEHIESLAQDRTIMERLSRALAAAHPSFSRALDAGIRRGIDSRRERGC